MNYTVWKEWVILSSIVTKGKGDKDSDHLQQTEKQLIISQVTERKPWGAYNSYFRSQFKCTFFKGNLVLKVALQRKLWSTTSSLHQTIFSKSLTQL